MAHGNIIAYLRGGELDGYLQRVDMMAKEVTLPTSYLHYATYVRTPDIVRVKEKDSTVSTHRVYLWSHET